MWLYSLNYIKIDSPGKQVCKLIDVLEISCKSGNLLMAKWLYSLGIDIHWNDDQIFVSTCLRGRLDVAKWIYSLGDVDIHAHEDDAFIYSCNYGYLEVARWLYSIGNFNVNLQTEYTLDELS